MIGDELRICEGKLVARDSSNTVGRGVDGCRSVGISNAIFESHHDEAGCPEHRPSRKPSRTSSSRSREPSRQPDGLGDGLALSTSCSQCFKDRLRCAAARSRQVRRF